MPLTTRYGFADAPTSAIVGDGSLAWTTSSSSLAAAGTSLTVLSSSAFPAAMQFDIIIGVRDTSTGVWTNAEIRHVTVVSGTTWTVSAGALDHVSGESISHILTSAGVKHNPGALTDSGDMPYLNASGRMDRLAAPADGAYSVTWTSGVPSWTSASGGGLTFPDLASPPGGTALGSTTLPFDGLYVTEAVISNGVFPTDDYGNRLLIADASDSAYMSIAGISDGYAQAAFRLGYVTQLGAFEPNFIFTSEINDDADALSKDMYMDMYGDGRTNFGSAGFFAVNMKGDIGIGNCGFNFATSPVGIQSANIIVDGATGNTVVKGTVTATDFIVSGSAFKTDTTNAHTGLFQAYDVDGAAYKTFATLTNGNTPSFALSAPSGGTLTGDFSTLKVGGVNVSTSTATGTVTSIATTSPISGGTITSTGTISLLVNTDFLFTASQSVTKTVNATSADGLVITNTATATTGAQQWSPRLRLSGQGFKSNAVTASQAADWIVETIPVQGATVITSQLSFSSQIAAGGYTQRVYVTDAGRLSANVFQTLSGQSVLSAPFNGTWAIGNGTSDGAYIQTGTGGGVAIGATAFFAFSQTATNAQATLDVVLARDAAGTLALRNTSNAQKLKVYNTFTTIDTAGEWFAIDWITTANVCNLQAVKGSSTGTARVLTISYGGNQAAPTAAITVPITSGNIVFGGGVQLSNAAVTGLTPGVLAASTNASIVLYDSGGQAYRVPCII